MVLKTSRIPSEKDTAKLTIEGGQQRRKILSNEEIVDFVSKQLIREAGQFKWSLTYLNNTPSTTGYRIGMKLRNTFGIRPPWNSLYIHLRTLYDLGFINRKIQPGIHGALPLSITYSGRNALQKFDYFDLQRLRMLYSGLTLRSKSEIELLQGILKSLDKAEQYIDTLAEKTMDKREARFIKTSDSKERTMLIEILKKRNPD